MKHIAKLSFVLGLAPAAALAHPAQGVHTHFETGMAVIAGLVTAAAIFGIATAMNRKMRSRAPTAGARRSRT
jgi:hypothetical protein